MSEILVVGSLAYDSIETPFGKVQRTLGGSANYFSVAASLFSKVRVVGVVGEDYEQKDFAILKSRNIDTSGMTTQKGKTFHWSGAYEGSMNEAQTRLTELNVFESFNPELPAHYKDSKFVFLANIAPELQGKVLDQVQKPLLVGMDTMNFWIHSKMGELTKVLKRVDLVLINETEAMMLTKGKNAVEAARKVTEMGPSTIVMKRGEYGFMMYNKESGFFVLPAFPMEKVVDPTGAGDTFAGGFFGYLASLNRKPSSTDLKHACMHGTVMASFTIQDFGLGSLSKVQTADVLNRLEQYKRVVAYSL